MFDLTYSDETFWFLATHITDNTPRANHSLKSMLRWQIIQFSYDHGSVLRLYWPQIIYTD